MKLIWIHFLLFFRDHLRQPIYVLTSLIFPAMFFWFFAVPNIHNQNEANMMIGSFLAFGFIGIQFFQTANQVALERSSSWFRYLNILPVQIWHLVIAKLILLFVMNFLCLVVLNLTSLLTTGWMLETHKWFKIYSHLTFWGIPFILAALTVGHLTTPKNSLPISNILYLPFSFAGGLWMPPNLLPQAIQKISDYLPTRFYGELAWSLALEQNINLNYIKGLSIYFILFFMTAYWAILKSKKQRL